MSEIAYARPIEVKPIIFVLNYKRRTRNIRGLYEYSVTKLFHDEVMALTARLNASNDPRNSAVKLKIYEFKEIVKEQEK